MTPDRIIDPAPRTRPFPSNGRIVGISDLVHLKADGDCITVPESGFVSARAAKRAYRNAVRLEMWGRLPDIVIGAVIGGVIVAAALLVFMPFLELRTGSGHHRPGGADHAG